jgi:hypothetical protein
LLMRRFLSLQGSTELRIKGALKFAQHCRELKVPIFDVHPELSAELDHIAAQPVEYIAHEYFNADWTSFYQNEVAERFGAIGLSYAASAQPFDNAERLCFGQAAIQILDQVAGDQRETLKDVLLNRSFRYDIYAPESSNAQTTNSFDVLRRARFLLAAASVDAMDEYLTPDAEQWTIPRSLYPQLLTALLTGPVSADTLVAAGRLAGCSLESIINALILLLGCGVATVALDGTDGADRAQRARRLNAALIDRTLRGDRISFMLSPVDGLAYEVPAYAQFFIAAEWMQKEPVAYAWRVLKGTGQRLSVDGQPLKSEADNVVELEKRFQDFQARLRPVLSRLQVV